MDERRFDDSVRRLAAPPTRRALLRALAAGGAAGLAGLTGLAGAVAKKKRKKRRRRTPGQELLDARCSVVPSSSFSTRVQFAVTFEAERSGRLTRALILLRSNEAAADFRFEIRAVASGGEPTATVLARTVVPNVPVVDGGSDPAFFLEARFPNPAAVVAGQRYALAVSSAADNRYYGFSPGPNDRCPASGFYTSADGGATWLSGDPARAIHFATWVTA